MVKSFRNLKLSLVFLLFFCGFITTPKNCSAQFVDWSWKADMDSVWHISYNMSIDEEGSVYNSTTGTKIGPINFYGTTIIPKKPGQKSWINKADSAGKLVWNLSVDQLENKGDSFRFLSLSVFNHKLYATSEGSGLIEVMKNGTAVDTLDFLHMQRNYTLWKFDLDGNVEWTRNLYDTLDNRMRNNFNYMLTFNPDDSTINYYFRPLTPYDDTTYFIETGNTTWKDFRTELSSCGGSGSSFMSYKIAYKQNGNLHSMYNSKDSFNHYPWQYAGGQSNLHWGTLWCGSQLKANGYTFNVDTNYQGIVDNKYRFSPLFTIKSNLHYRPYLLAGDNAKHSLISFVKGSPLPNQNQTTADSIYSYPDNKYYKVEDGEYLLLDNDYKLIRRKRVFKIEHFDSITFGHNYHHAFTESHIFGYIHFSNYKFADQDLFVDGLKYTLPARTHGSMLFKLDTLLNVLWIRLDAKNIYTGVFSPYHLRATPSGDLILMGTNPAGVTTHFFDDTLHAKSHGYQAIIKLHDHSIKRGDVNYGPYCAGDSILIPFTKDGIFDTANTFVAELSDETGSFEDSTKVFVLGRLKTNQSDTIVGELPLFEVASSQNYRIRVRSTHPVIQSDFRRDTLRLLIYSRDSADPGPSEVICFGDSIQLNTFGGTAWEWSPATAMNDSSLRRPKAAPDSSITYRIVISDSSGCGEADTAFKFVRVRKNPKILFPQSDTIVCIGTEVAIPVNFAQGDTANYNWMWFEIDQNNRPTLLDIRTNDTTSSDYVPGPLGGTGTDTLFYQLPPDVTDQQKIRLTLRDRCSPQVDIQHFIIKTRKDAPTVKLNPTDSAICPNTQLKIHAHFSNGYNNNYKWSWYDANQNVLATDSGAAVDTLSISPDFSTQNNTQYTVIVDDQCAPSKDTAQINITARNTLDISSSPADTLLCKGQKTVFTAAASGGFPENYSWKSFDAQGNLLSNSDTLSRVADTTENLTVIVSDGCMPENDTVQVTLRVNPPLQAKILKPLGGKGADTSVCFGSVLNFLADGEGGDQTGYDFSWWVDGVQIATTKDFQFTFNQQDHTTQNLTLILKDNCTEQEDTLPLQIEVLPRLNIGTTVQDSLCLGEELNLTALPNGGKTKSYTYQWIWEGQEVAKDSIANLKLTPTIGNQGLLQLVLSDGCTMPNDTFSKTIYFRPELNLSLSALDTCVDDNILITALPKGGMVSSYQIEWKDLQGTVLGNGTTVNVSPSGIQTYFATLSDGCTELEIIDSLQLGEKPKFDLVIDPVEGCEPLEVNYTLQTDYPDAFDWIIDHGNGVQENFTSPQNQSVVVYSAGNFIPTAQLTTSIGCMADWTGGNITVHPKPTAQFEFVPELPNLDNPEVQFVNLSTGAQSYIWNLGGMSSSTEFEPTYFFNDSGTYLIQLIATSTEGCSDSTTNNLTVAPTYFVYVPNAFSPNNDGNNDVFKPVVAGVSDYYFQVFNRWGELIFEGKMGQSWDGTYKGRLVPPGVYFYVVPVTKLKGGKETARGTVHLLR